MLSQNAFEVWCQKLALSEQAKASLSQIRSSPPARLVRSAAGNVSGRYPSTKMGCTIQFESHRGELAAIYQFEHDPVVLEFYDQPPVLKLTCFSLPSKCPIAMCTMPLAGGLVLQEKPMPRGLDSFTAFSPLLRLIGSISAICVFWKTTSVFHVLLSRPRSSMPFAPSSWAHQPSRS
jgi:hypothetical protein